MWPFKKRTESEPKRDEKERVTLFHVQNVVTENRITCWLAYFTNGRPMSVEAEEAVDALGKLALAHPDRFGLTIVNAKVAQTRKNTKRGKLYICVCRHATAWVAIFTGLNLVSRPGRLHNTVDFISTKPWESRERAVGILIIDNPEFVKVSIDHVGHPEQKIRLQHPTDVNPDDDDSRHCIFCEGRCVC
jgi:hypothetical protein